MSLSPQLWLEHIKAWKQTSQTQADYCREQGLSPHQFSYWKRKQNQTTAVQQRVTSGFAVAQFETIATTHQGLSVLPYLMGQGLMIFMLPMPTSQSCFWELSDNATNIKTSSVSAEGLPLP